MTSLKRLLTSGRIYYGNEPLSNPTRISWNSQRKNVLLLNIFFNNKIINELKVSSDKF